MTALNEKPPSTKRLVDLPNETIDMIDKFASSTQRKKREIINTAVVKYIKKESKQ